MRQQNRRGQRLMVVTVLLLTACIGAASAWATDISDVSPTKSSFRASAFAKDPVKNAADPFYNSVSGRMTALAAASDGKRLYAGAFSGVWRSDDAGSTWRQLTRPQPSPGSTYVPNALAVPNIVDLAVSSLDPDLVFAGTTGDARVTPRNGLYRSRNGGENWGIVRRSVCLFGDGCPPLFDPCPALPGAPETFGDVTQIVFAPDDPSRVYAAGGCEIAFSTNGGTTWRVRALPGSGRIYHLAVAPAEGLTRRVYGAGPGQLWYSADGGETWKRDSTGSLIPAGFGTFPDSCCGNSPRVLAVEPGRPDHVFLAVPALANGPSFYANQDRNAKWKDGDRCNVTSARTCNEGSLWYGDYSAFAGSAGWRQLPGPPVYFGNSTDSGNVYVLAKPTSRDYLLFFSDRSHVHVADGLPSASRAWHRLDGRDVSQSKRDNDLTNKLFLHVDPHVLAVSPDFDLTLENEVFVAPPYNANSELDLFLGGTLWMANDGGVYRSTDGGRKYLLGDRLTTLQPDHLAGVAIAGRSPALYMGVPDNDNFSSLNRGTTWGNPASECGDCGPWFADAGLPGEVLEVAARDNPPGFGLYSRTSSFGSFYPDASLLDGFTRRLAIPAPASVCDDGSPMPCLAPAKEVPGSPALFDLNSRLGNRPVIQTLASEPDPATLDVVIIRTFVGGTRVLMRAQNLRTITRPSDWTFTAEQQGPTLPARTIDVVQASGGHTSPTYYVGDPDGSMRVWKWTAGMPAWQQIVPGVGVARAHRFFVDPYDPSTVYVVDDGGIRRSDDGGLTWFLDANLDAIATESGVFAYDGGSWGRTPFAREDGGVIVAGSILADLVFDRNTLARFAVGDAGVFASPDFDGWTRLMSTTALPGHPVSAYFNGVTSPCDNALYVAMNGRGVLRFGPVPPFC